MTTQTVTGLAALSPSALSGNMLPDRRLALNDYYLIETKSDYGDGEFDSYFLAPNKSGMALYSYFRGGMVLILPTATGPWPWRHRLTRLPQYGSDSFLGPDTDSNWASNDPHSPERLFGA